MSGGAVHRERRLPVEGGGDGQPGRADEFEDAEGHPGFPRQRTKGRDLLAYLVEHEDLHDARRSVQERGEDLQDPQQHVHRVPPPGFRVGGRRAVSPLAIHVLSLIKRPKKTQAFFHSDQRNSFSAPRLVS
jgi:hypothetical protein